VDERGKDVAGRDWEFKNRTGRGIAGLVETGIGQGRENTKWDWTG
jgi:hypothetical protein